MTWGEFQIIWHDWLRGVSAIALLVVLVALYFLEVFSQPVYTMVLLCAAAGAGLAFIVATCVTSVLPVWLRVAGAAVALVAGGLAIAGAVGLLFPGPDLVTARVSNAAPATVLEIPVGFVGTQGYLTVRGHPGASPGGEDEEITGTLRIGADASSLALPVRLVKKRGAKSGGGKGPAISRRGSDSWQVPLDTPRLDVTLSDLKPRSALPLEISITVPRLALSIVSRVLWALALVALVLAFLTARRGAFPIVLPFCVVVATVFHLLSRGLSPTEPLLPALGILLGGGIAGAAVAYLAAKVLERLLGPGVPHPT